MISSRWDALDYCWCDSTVALSWSNDDSSDFNVFVANRVATIQEQTISMEWHYVPTDQNPVDILSRGATPGQLMKSDIWFNGPAFLVGNTDEWPPSCALKRPSIEPRKNVLLIKSPYEDITVNCKFANSFAPINRVFAYIFKSDHRL
ncbi:GH23799 [Drosophila grimshawi]|uniref:GH23799 n=1 Tax=Drosophila grimshawi TaxID=7222 RepID=B4K0R3_DROGR|nr:GH23799 [Drosophila grimshawi]